MFAGRMGSVKILALCVFLIAAGIIGHQGYRLHLRRQYAAVAMMRAVGEEVRWRGYFRTYKAWPDPAYTPASRVVPVHYPFWISRDRTAFAIDVPVDDGVLRYYPGGVDLMGVAVWSTDGGETWRCGPYGIPLNDLPDSCHDRNPPAYTGPI